MSRDVQIEIKEKVTNNPIVLFMKGSSTFPQCGFSARAVEILKLCGINSFASINVLEDLEIREGVKKYSNWPTIPQLYIKGEFIGGCDIIQEMYEAGELQAKLKEISKN